jgi:hypothetical protein
VTPAEITILRSLAEADVVTFMPEGTTRAAVGRFEATLASQGNAEGGLGRTPDRRRKEAPAGSAEEGGRGTMHGGRYREALRLLGGYQEMTRQVTPLPPDS